MPHQQVFSPLTVECHHAVWWQRQGRSVWRLWLYSCSGGGLQWALQCVPPQSSLWSPGHWMVGVESLKERFSHIFSVTMTFLCRVSRIIELLNFLLLLLWLFSLGMLSKVDPGMFGPNIWTFQSKHLSLRACVFLFFFHSTHPWLWHTLIIFKILVTRIDSDQWLLIGNTETLWLRSNLPGTQGLAEEEGKPLRILWTRCYLSEALLLQRWSVVAWKTNHHSTMRTPPYMKTPPTKTHLHTHLSFIFNAIYLLMITF